MKLPLIEQSWCAGEVKSYYVSKPTKLSSVEPIKTSRELVEYLRTIIKPEVISYCEMAWAVYLNRAGKSIGWAVIGDGGMSATIVDLRKVFKKGLDLAAVNVIICHNHPSGSRLPSASDTILTKKVKDAGEIMDIGLLDHIILTVDSYYSFADECNIL